MNYIAQCYCEEDRTDAKLLDGIRFSNKDYELESIETVSETLRLDGSPEYQHEHRGGLSKLLELFQTASRPLQR